MGAMSRRKGAAFEQEMVRLAKACGFVGARRTYMSGGYHEKGDLAGLPFHAECKNATPLSIPAWWKQTVTECPLGAEPVLFVRLPGNPGRPAEVLAITRPAYLQSILDPQRLPLLQANREFQDKRLVKLTDWWRSTLLWRQALPRAVHLEEGPCLSLTARYTDSTGPHTETLYCLRAENLLRLAYARSGQLTLGEELS